MHYQKSVSIGGAWAKASELMAKGVKRAKIVSEAQPIPSQFQNKDGSIKMQDVAKIKYEGEQDSLNTNLNRATINGLISAFGEDSKLWMDKILNVEFEKVKVAGKTQLAMYFVPEGFEKVDDAEGYTTIRKKSSEVSDEIPTINIEDSEEDSLRVEDVPF